MDKTYTIIITICSIITISLLVMLIKNTVNVNGNEIGEISGLPTSGPQNNKYSSNPLQFTSSFNTTDLKKINKELTNNKEHHLLTNAITKNPVKEVLLDNLHSRNIKHRFSHRLKPKTKITDQKNSGRCWIFSYLNMFRYKIVGEYSLPESFEFSQTYLCFFDKLEKCYYFLQNIAISKDIKLASRKLDWMLKSCLSDGGNWNMLVNLINKYGIVPKDAMPETFSSSNTSSLNIFLRHNLRRMAYAIRSSDTGGKSLTEYIDLQIQFIYKLLCSKNQTLFLTG